MTNQIRSLTQKYLLCLYDKHWGQRKGACGVSAGDFRDYAGWLHHLIAGSVSKPSENPYYIVSCAKPPWHGQTSTKYRKVSSTFFFMPNSSVRSITSIQSLIHRQWGNIIFTATKTKEQQNPTCMDSLHHSRCDTI